MNYKGKLYGRVGKSYFPLLKTSEEYDNILILLREAVMRGQMALPENSKDLEWFDEGLNYRKSGDFMERLFKALELGDYEKFILNMKSKPS